MVNLICYLLAAAGTAYIAAIYQSVAFAVLFLAEMAYLIAAYLWILFGVKNVSATLKIPIAMTETGHTATLKLCLKNRSAFFPIWLKVRVAYESTDAYTSRTLGRRTVALMLGGRKEIKKPLHIVFRHAGGYRCHISRIRVYDPLGILYLPRRARKEAARESVLYVLPEIYGVRIQLGEPVRHFYGESNIYDEEKAGDDHSEIFRIREFVPGDKVQTIHWKLSARTGRLMVRESGLPRGCPVILLADKTSGFGKPARQGAYYGILSSVGYSLLERKCPFYLVWRTDRIFRWRVDDEESFYEAMIAMLHAGSGRQKHSGSLLEAYLEHYKGEAYIAALILNNDLRLCQARRQEPESEQEPEQIAGFAVQELEEQLEILELLV